MRQYIYRIIALLLICGSGTVKNKPLNAQEISGKNHDFSYVRKQDGWLESLNATGLRFIPMDVSFAEGYAVRKSGKYMQTYESSDAWTLGIKSESFRRFKHISFYGKMQYEYFRGNKMSGSMLVCPEEYPYDMLEFSPGRKTLEKYIFSGGIGMDIGERFTGGLRINYETDNYAKRRDLRHKNTRLNLEVMPGAAFTSGQFTIGLNYIFGKKTETFEAEVIGKEKEYYAFYNRGLWSGTYSLYNGGSLHLNETGLTGFPIRNITNGIAGQFSVSGECFRFFNEFAYRHTEGRNGEKGFIWYKDNTNQLNYNGTLNIRKSGKVHLVKGNFSYQNTKGYENTITREEILGFTQPVIYGNSQTLQQRKINAGLEYEINWGAEQFLPSLSVKAGGEFNNRSLLSTLMYPYYRSQYIDTYRIYGGVGKNFFSDRSSWRAEIVVGYYTGNGNKLTENQKNNIPEGLKTSDYPLLLEEYLEYEYEYLSNQSMDCSALLRYSHLTGKTPVPVYAELSADYRLILEKRQWVNGRERSTLTLRIGCMF